MSLQKNNLLFLTLNASAERLIQQFDQIPTERKILLRELTHYIQAADDKPVYLNFICTHNSRRSHISQLWAQAAAYYFDVKNITCFSGGTEATAFNPRALNAMQEVGFKISMKKEGHNPLYEVTYASNAVPVAAFSKKYDDPFNTNPGFAAIMTCSHADENCPLVIGASARIALTYNDPKEFDGTALEGAKYAERVHEIGREILFTFSEIKFK
jgi:arsenate reductase (thioredoxin)